MGARTDRIVILGKGGVGKSTIASNLSVEYARQGLKVLHIGCDPKHDSTLALVSDGPVPTFLEQYLAQRTGNAQPSGPPEPAVVRGRLGIDCVEAGGPEPGVGCAGRGIALMLEAFQASDLIRRRGYDVVLFDVLGDVVCGGFATPLRRGFGEKVLIVISEELMALYAANNVARAIQTYSANGVRLAGLVANLRDPDGDRARVEAFAKSLGTELIGVLPRDPAVRDAEYTGNVTAVEHAPDSPFAQAVVEFAAQLRNLDPATCPPPTPADDRSFFTTWRVAPRSRDG